MQSETTVQVGDQVRTFSTWSATGNHDIVARVAEVPKWRKTESSRWSPFYRLESSEWLRGYVFRVPGEFTRVEP
jgi:hypothetical protein